MTLSRRGLLGGIGLVAVAAPAVIRTPGLLMRIRPQRGPAWLSADGRAISRNAYPDLFAALGTVYGAGDGATTFNLPDLRGRVAVTEATPRVSSVSNLMVYASFDYAILPYSRNGMVAGVIVQRCMASPT